MSALFSMIRKEFIPASRSLMPMQSPEKPAPTMRTSTEISETFESGAAVVVMWRASYFEGSRSPSEREGNRRLPAKTGGLRESSVVQAARHAERLARFSVPRERPPRERVRRDVSNRQAVLHSDRRE